MWSEEKDMDKKIKEAAETGSYGFEEKNWQAMETLLDKHLPQEKKRRRFLIILLFAALIAVPAIFIIQRSTSKDTTIAEQKQKNIPAKETGNNKVQQDPINKTLVDKDNTNVSTIETDLPGNSNSVIKSPPVNSDEVLIPVNKTQKELSTTNKKSNNPDKPIYKEEKASEDSRIVETGGKKTAIQPGNKNDIVPSNSENIQPITAEQNIADNKKTEDKTGAPAPSINNEQQPAKTSTTKNKNSKFSINLSAGTDISSVGTRPGTAEMAYGIGIGYSISDRWAVRAGFFAGRKKYGAKPDDYHPEDSYFWYYYPNMQKIDANCYVYEIPVNVVYNFSKSKNHNWFISGGVSSYLMKEEKYDYTYKSWSGQIRHSSYTYKNENSHLFSVINLSGGYQYNFNKRFSLLAEPYIKMPVSGIGFGKVNLNSAGIMFTGSFKPFSRK